MDSRLNVKHQAGGNSSSNGVKPKKGAFEKLHHMEWIRNNQDAHYLARSCSQTNDCQEKKKYNKDEDNYFEGTGVQKTKKARRPKVCEASSSNAPDYNVTKATKASSSPPPPQVNAWSKKKGSELFQKDDQDDIVMKRVLEESIKSLEQDEKRRLERLRMTNADIDVTTFSMCAERDYEDKLKKENIDEELDSDEYQQQSELHFVETDVNDKPSGNQRHRSIPPRATKSSPIKKSTSPLANETLPQSPTLNTKARECSGGLEPDIDDFENTDNAKPLAIRSNAQVEIPISQLQTGKQFSRSTSFQRPGEDVNVRPEDEVDLLTFGETKDAFENFKHNETLGDETFPDSGAEENSVAANEVLDTDLFVHNFIRHEPPAQNVLHGSAVIQPAMNGLFSQSAPNVSLPNPHQAHFPHYFNQGNVEHPPINGFSRVMPPPGIPVPNGQDSISSGSGSSLLSPFGSLENEVPNAIHGVSVPSQLGGLPAHTYPYSVDDPESLRQQFEATRNLSSQPGQAQNVFPQFGLSQYGLPSGLYQQNLDGQLQQLLQAQQQLQPGQQQMLQQVQQQLHYQAQQQNLQEAQKQLLHQMQSLNLQQIQPQLQQAAKLPMAYNNTQQPPCFSISDKPENHVGSPISPTIPTLNQPYGFLPNQFQSIPTEMMSKQEDLQQMLNGLKMPGGPSREDLQLKYMNALQALRVLQEQMQEAQIEPVASAKLPSPWDVPTPVVPQPAQQLGMYPMGMHAQMMQQAFPPGQMSAGIPQSMLGHPTSNSLDRNVISVPEAMPPVGRGRGRFP